MSLIARLTKLEARLLRDRVIALPPSLTRPVGMDGELLEPRIIEQLGNSWPLVRVHEWVREPEESADAFIDRVMNEAPPNAMLRQVVTP